MVKFIPFLESIILLALFEQIFYLKQNIYFTIFLLLIIISVIVSQWLISYKKIFRSSVEAQKSNNNILLFSQLNYWIDFLSFLILPLFLSISIFFFLLLIPQTFFRHLIIFFGVFVIYLYFRNLYYYFHKKQEYKVNSLENISLYANILTFFLLSSSFFAFIIFLNSRIWIIMLWLLLFGSTLIYQLFWISKVELKKNLFYLIIIVLIVEELFWSITLLPLDYYSKGILLSLVYYTVIGLSKYKLDDNLTSKIVKRYLFISIASIVLILFTAKWI